MAKASIAACYSGLYEEDGGRSTCPYIHSLIFSSLNLAVEMTSFPVYNSAFPPKLQSFHRCDQCLHIVLLTPNAGCTYPQMGLIPSLPYFPVLIPGLQGHVLPQCRLEGVSLQLPSTSSATPSTSGQSHEDSVSPFLSLAEDRQFRDSDYSKTE